MLKNILSKVVAESNKISKFAAEISYDMKVLVTAGPTYEKIDPVRFIGNFSTGKMGVAIAAAFAERGDEVELVCGPITAKVPESPLIHRTDVVSACEMYDAVMERFGMCDGAVLCAAVADYTPAHVYSEKVKRETTGPMTIELVPTQDIAAACGKAKRENQFMVGFALETCDEMTHAADKLKRKNLDFIVMNSLKVKGAGFGVDTNVVTFVYADGHAEELPLMPKTEVAREIVKRITKE